MYWGACTVVCGCQELRYPQWVLRVCWYTKEQRKEKYVLIDDGSVTGSAENAFFYPTDGDSWGCFWICISHLPAVHERRWMVSMYLCTCACVCVCV